MTTLNSTIHQSFYLNDVYRVITNGNENIKTFNNRFPLFISADKLSDGVERAKASIV